MNLLVIAEQFQDRLFAKYADRLLPSHRHALRAILRCRTPASGELHVRCPDCGRHEWRPLSCGHRSCPQCQNHEASQWLDRQQAKLLPVSYFMVTFTLPCELRALAWNFQSKTYAMLFACAIATLKDFGLNPKHLGADLGMTAVLHTQTRRLDYHPHLHVIVPGGGIDKRRRQWKKLKGGYLFNAFNIAKVFRAKFLEVINKAGLKLSVGVREKWVVDCEHVGQGLPALKYLSRYLYRGVISENNILSCRDGEVTFRYIESETGNTCTRTVKGEDFLWLVLQHVLPRGFRRVRDYGFLHGNAKKVLKLVQLILHVMLEAKPPRPRPVIPCPCCRTAMIVTAFRRPAWASG
ncbi:IS91 family transposase [Geothermobacter hydrogeniphilus]|uniref:IS91 family transposase n=1 Tax=Geothermobacter hydrogeniphilus TaxID=1969733 RepID=A0A1X0YBE5_9BACT|nr:transposase [Geothermobacter hydrogeniphilus]ORJ62521.1 IS91 family transposase [Geothermobacter hydrogeniphilus]